MKHPALTKVMSAALAVMCLVMIGFGAVRISGAVENRDRSREAAQNLAEKTENYIKLSAELDSSPVDYDEVSEEQTERRDKYDSDNSKHRADVAEYTATKGGTAMGSLALDEAAYAIQVGWEQYYAGVRELNEQLGDYAFLLDELPSEEQLAELGALIEQTRSEVEKYKGSFDEMQSKLDELREQGVDEITLGELKDMIEELLKEKAELELREQELEAAYADAGADMALVDSVRAELEADGDLSPDELYDELERRVYELTGKTVEEIAASLEENGEKLEEIKAAIKEIMKRIEDADGKLEDVTVTLDEVQQGLDDARRLYDEANAKLEELLGLYDKLVMLIKAKAMMDQAAETLEAGETEIGTAWYKLQQTKAGLADTEKRLKNEKEQLIKDYNKLSEVDRTVDEYNDLTARQKAARTALVLYPDIKTRTEAGEDVAAAAQAVRDSMEKELEREFAGRLGISILCIAAGIFGILTLPAAFERMRTYPALRVFAILSLACAVGAECVGLFMGWGQTYAAVFGALFALLVLLVGGRAKIAAI